MAQTKQRVIPNPEPAEEDPSPRLGGFEMTRQKGLAWVYGITENGQAWSQINANRHKSQASAIEAFVVELKRRRPRRLTCFTRARTDANLLYSLQSASIACFNPRARSTNKGTGLFRPMCRRVTLPPETHSKYQRQDQRAERFVISSLARSC